MSVDVTNETQWVIDPKVFSDLVFGCLIRCVSAHNPI